MMELVVLRPAAFVTLGGLLGYAYFAALELNLRLYLVSGAGWLALLIHAMRVLAVTVAFTCCARSGGPALIFSLAGFQLIRTVAVNRQTLVMTRKS